MDIKFPQKANIWNSEGEVRGSMTSAKLEFSDGWEVQKVWINAYVADGGWKKSPTKTR